MKIETLFGEHIELKQSKGNQIPGRNKSGGYINNPMHFGYGKMDGEKCKNCAFLVKKSYSKTYYKCELRNNVDSCSLKSDHRVNWTACGKFKMDDK